MKNFIDEQPHFFANPEAMVKQYIANQYEDPLEAFILIDRYIETIKSDIQNRDRIDLQIIWSKIAILLKDFNEDDPDVKAISTMINKPIRSVADLKKITIKSLEKIFFKFLTPEDALGTQIEIVQAMTWINRLLSEFPEDRDIRNIVEETIEQANHCALRKVQRSLLLRQKKLIKGTH